MCGNIENHSRRPECDHDEVQNEANVNEQLLQEAEGGFVRSGSVFYAVQIYDLRERCSKTQSLVLLLITMMMMLLLCRECYQGL